MLILKPFFERIGLGFLSGESGKQERPGNKAFLSAGLGTFSYIIESSSAKMQPMAQISMGSP